MLVIMVKIMNAMSSVKEKLIIIVYQFQQPALRLVFVCHVKYINVLGHIDLFGVFFVNLKLKDHLGPQIKIL